MKYREYISTHEEFVKSINDQDGRKWRFEERADKSYYIEVVEDRSPYATGRIETPMEKRGRKIRELMRKRVRKPDKPYTCRLGYHSYSAQYTGDEQYAPFSGSSMNRKQVTVRKKYDKKPGECIHRLSRRSRKKVKDKATAFFRSNGKDRVFMTLTFIQHVTDQLGVKILNKFLTVMRKENPSVQYLWVAEHQPQRSDRTIHFHVLLNKRMPVERYNSLWVMQQYNAGLRGRRANGEIIDQLEIEAAIASHKVGKLLNPLDLRKAYGVNSLAAYLTKYVTKQPDNEGFKCRTWHSSRRVSRLFTRQTVEASTLAYLRSLSNYYLDRKTGELTPAYERREAFYSTIAVNNVKLAVNRLGQLEQLNEAIMKKGISFAREDLMFFNWEWFRKLYAPRNQKNNICSANL